MNIMSGSFEELHVPPTLVSFAVTTAKTGDIISGDFKKPGHRVVLIKPEYSPNGLPEGESLKAVFARVHGLIASGRAAAVCACGFGGAAECVMSLAKGSRKSAQAFSRLAPPTDALASSQMSIPAGAATAAARPSTNSVRSNMERTTTFPTWGAR